MYCYRNREGVRTFKLYIPSSSIRLHDRPRQAMTATASFEQYVLLIHHIIKFDMTSPSPSSPSSSSTTDIIIAINDQHHHHHHHHHHYHHHLTCFIFWLKFPITDSFFFKNLGFVSYPESGGHFLPIKFVVFEKSILLPPTNCRSNNRLNRRH